MSNIEKTPQQKRAMQAERERLGAAIAFHEAVRRGQIKDAEACVIHIIRLTEQIEPEWGISRITDAKKIYNMVRAYRQAMLNCGLEKHPVLEPLMRLIAKEMMEKYAYDIEAEFGSVEMKPKQDMAKLEVELADLEAKRVAIHSDMKRQGKEPRSPKTDAKIAEVKAKIAEANATTASPSTQLSPKESGMGNNVADAVKIQNVEVVRHGDKLTIPQNLDIGDAIKLLQARLRYEEETATILEDYNVFPWDGAIATGKVLQRIFGWVPTDAASIMVDCDVDKKVSVPWGEFQIPGIDGKLHCDATRKEGRIIFRIHAVVKHKHEHIVKNILAQVKDELKVSSIYRGKAVKIRFLNDDGDILPMPEPKFIDVMNIDEANVAYAKPVADAIETNLFTPIRRIKELEANGLKIQRSVLLGGMFGTGKTLAAAVAAKLAVGNGLTYIYVQRAEELSHALAFSRMYQDPACMLFCEDIDRLMSGGRDKRVDDVLNTVDGVDTKNDRRMMVFTTNDLDVIEQAMLRPGRLDAVIEVTPPDAQAAWKLVQIYGKDTLAPDADGYRVGEKLAGQIPAVIAEVVKRAKLSQLKFTPVGERVTNIGTDALLDAADTMVRQLELLNRKGAAPMMLHEALAVVGDAYGGDWKEPSDSTKAIATARHEASKGLPAIRRTA